MASLVQLLLAQARHLAITDPTRPQQVNLRRAISGTYYALFHFLIEEANRFLLGTTAARAGLRDIVTRAFTHTEMATTARSFVRGTLPAAIVRRLGPLAIPNAVRQLAEAFLDLQDQRHLADYDVSESFLRGEVIVLVEQAETAVAAWPAVRDDPAAELFLLGLLVWNRIRDR